VPDIGLGEILVIVVLALLVFGPDRLPKVAADAARMLRQVRRMAASARQDLVDAAGLEDDGEMAQAVRDLRELDPRRAVQGLLTDDPASGGSAPGGATSNRASAPGPAPAAPVANRPGIPGPAATGQAAAGDVPAPGGAHGAQPVAPPVVAPAQADPDWT
jgi:sec-independent protein translocase protein TatB